MPVQFACTSSKPAVVLSPPTTPPELGFFHLLCTDSDRYTGTIYIVTGVWLETDIKLHILGEFWESHVQVW